MLIAVLALSVLQWRWEAANKVERVPYSMFKTYLADGRVDELTVTRDQVTGRFVDPNRGDPEFFVTPRVDRGFAEELAAAGVEFTVGSDGSFIATLASWVVPIRKRCGCPIYP